MEPSAEDLCARGGSCTSTADERALGVRSAENEAQ